MPELLTIADAAVELAVSERTIRRALHDPRRPLPCFHIGRAVRIERAELRRWLERQRAPLPIANQVDPAVADILSRLNSKSAPQLHPARGGARKACASVELSSSDLRSATTNQAPEPTQ